MKVALPPGVRKWSIIPIFRPFGTPTAVGAATGIWPLIRRSRSLATCSCTPSATCCSARSPSSVDTPPPASGSASTLGQPTVPRLVCSCRRRPAIAKAHSVAWLPWPMRAFSAGSSTRRWRTPKPARQTRCALSGSLSRQATNFTLRRATLACSPQKPAARQATVGCIAGFSST